MPHLVIIDGSNYVFRAFHAIRHLSNSKGEPTNAVYGYVQMVRAVLNELHPTHVAVAFDPQGGSFRNKLYPEYKAHRPPMPEDLVGQWSWIRDVTRAFNLPLIVIDNFEADDVIATLSRQANQREWDTTIVSSDKDLMQLVNARTHMLDTMKRVRFDPKAVRKKWGVEPARLHDLLALAGDASDNIPGIPGIGPKTAALLINTYGGLEDVLRSAEQVRQQKRRQSLIEFAEDARLSYRLVQLREDTPLDVRLDDLAVQEPNRDRLAQLFSLLEFQRLRDEFSEKVVPILQSNRTDRLVNDKESLESLLEALNRAELIAIDTETTSLNCHDAEIVGLSFAVREGEGWYIPLGHIDASLNLLPAQLGGDEVLQAIRPILESADRIKCGHNLKYDMQTLRRTGIELRGIGFDSMLLAYCLYPGKYAPSLDNTARDYLHHTCISYSEITGKGAKQIGFAEVPIAQALPYAAEDAEVCLRLTHTLSEQLQAENRLQRHQEIELPLLRVLADMEWKGVRVDAGLLNSLSGEFTVRIRDVETVIHQKAGYNLNIHSPKQLGELLFDKLGLPGGKKTKSGQWATGQTILEALATDYEIAKMILEVRQLAKLKSTYTDALIRLTNPQTGRVHTSYNQAITTTGRLSSSDPNLQNIPIRTMEGRRIRKAFVAESGNILISADYSQIELRLMAHFSADRTLCAAFEHGLDIHAATAASVHNLPVEEVTGEQRRHAKIINFGILYGMSAFGLAQQLGVSRAEARRFIDAYFLQYPDVRAFMDTTLETARAEGYIETLLGHRVYVPEITSGNGMRRQYAERTAINAPLQGSAADIIKVAMIRLHERLQREGTEARLIMQVHDELVVEAPVAEADRVSTLMREEMQSAVRLNVPLTVEIGIGSNWYQAHKL